MATTDIEAQDPQESGGPLARFGRAGGTVSSSWNRFWRLVGIYMPKRLYARSLLIVITPMILLQSVVTLVFMERHWQTVTQRLSTATTRDLAAIIDMIETYPNDDDYSNVIRIAQERSVDEDRHTAARSLAAAGPQAVLLDPRPDSFDRDHRTDQAAVLDRHGRRFQACSKSASSLRTRCCAPSSGASQAYASNTHIFLVWMVGTSLVLLMIAIPFLRNQIKPILKLAEAAESFGKGRPMPPDFRPRGAEEVRRAGFAFIQMRERIERQIEQRTAMLTGVSHDLRTILTRFKLQLALSGSKPDVEAMDRDVDDMQSMLEGYLEFARGEAAEDPGRFDLAGYFETIAKEAKLRKRTLTTSLAGDPTIHVRPKAFARLLANVIGNSLRYAKNIKVEAVHTRGSLTVIIDDDGPGIPAASREDVFKPFVRLDEARNLDASGTGLGLSIARDIARSHGGDITLDDSPMGGLRAVVRVPA